MRARPLRLAGATLAGSIVATAVLLVVFALFDVDDWNTMTVLFQAKTPLAAAASVYFFVFLGGVLPAFLIGSVLIALRRGTSLRLVLAPATLFVLLAAEMARETHSATLSVLALPAIITGGAAMFWVLSKQKPAPAIEAVFE